MGALWVLSMGKATKTTNKGKNYCASKANFHPYFLLCGYFVEMCCQYEVNTKKSAYLSDISSD